MAYTLAETYSWVSLLNCILAICDWHWYCSSCHYYRAYVLL